MRRGLVLPRAAGRIEVTFGVSVGIEVAIAIGKELISTLRFIGLS